VLKGLVSNDSELLCYHALIDIETGTQTRLYSPDRASIMRHPVVLDHNKFTLSTHNWSTGVQRLLLYDRRQFKTAVLEDSSVNAYAQVEDATRLDNNSLALTGSDGRLRCFLYTIDIRKGPDLQYRNSLVDTPELY